VLAVLVMLLAISNLVTGALLISGRVTFERAFAQVPEMGDMQATFEQTVKVMLILVSVLGIAMAWGLWKLQNWSRATMRAFCVLGLLGALIQMIQAFTTKDALNFLSSAIFGGLYYWVFFYLGTTAARAAFGGAPSQPAPPAGGDSAG